jgi:hypothetical protein
MIFSGEFTPHSGTESYRFRFISLPKENFELRQALQNKLKEYESRLERISNPDPSKTTYGNEQHIDLKYKQLLLARLLRDGQINTDEMKRDLTAATGGVYETIFENAAGVIEDYVLTGGENLLNGTGLKTDI